MEQDIRRILNGLPGVRVQRIGDLWQVSVGTLAGARDDGISLAHDLRAQYEREETHVTPEPEKPAIAEVLAPRQEPEPVIVHVADPEQAARIAELEARLAEAEAALVEIHAPQVGPDAPIPDELADLISYAETPAQTSEKLLVKLREVMGLIGLAEDDGHRAAPELYRRRDRLESGIQWNRGRMAEVI